MDKSSMCRNSPGYAVIIINAIDAYFYDSVKSLADSKKTESQMILDFFLILLIL